MQVVARGLVLDAATQPPERKVNAFTGLARLQNGDFLCSFQSGPAKHHRTSTIRLFRSTDNGQTWTENPFVFKTQFKGKPGSLSSAGIVEATPGKLLLTTTWLDRTDPERELFDPVTEGILHSKQLKCFSTDDGETWSAWEQIPVPKLTGVAACGDLVKWPDGSIAYAFESYKDYDDTTQGRHGAWVVVSRDGGATFGPPELIGQHPEHLHYYWDQRMTPTPDGQGYVSMFWTHNLADKQDLTIHIRRAPRGAERNFEQYPIRDTGIHGQICAPWFLPDGRLVAFIVDRGEPRTMKLCWSTDGGLTWPTDQCLATYNHDEQARMSQGEQNVDFKEYWGDMIKWTFGHPAIRQIDPNHLLLVHYAGTPGNLSIHWERVRV